MFIEEFDEAYLLCDKNFIENNKLLLSSYITYFVPKIYFDY